MSTAISQTSNRFGFSRSFNARGMWSLLAPAAAICLIVIAAGCRREQSGQGTSEQVVLYSSADPEYVRPVIELFEQETGVRVLLAGDTEATKTTGLALRLLAEHQAVADGRAGHAKADVWWSSEPFWTIRLTREDALAPNVSAAAESSIEGGWPANLRDADARWYGFAQRARVFVYNTEHVSQPDVPRTLADLTAARFRGRVGMARPQFGTTRGHMGAILSALGEEVFTDWVESLKANDVRLYDGNMSVVRAVSTGEIHIGLTDTDDVWAGKRNGWNVEAAYEVRSSENGASAAEGMGALVMPNTVGLVAGAPNADAGRRLIDFLLSARVESMLAASDSHNIPVHPDAEWDLAEYAVPTPADVSLEDAAAKMDRAVEIFERIMGG